MTKDEYFYELLISLGKIISRKGMGDMAEIALGIILLIFMCGYDKLYPKGRSHLIYRRWLGK